MNISNKNCTSIKEANTKIDLLALYGSLLCILQDLKDFFILSRYYTFNKKLDKYIEQLSNEILNLVENNFVEKRLNTDIIIEEYINIVNEIYYIKDINDQVYNEECTYLYKKVIDYSLPECFGYNLSDLNMCIQDAFSVLENDDEVSIISIRTGGTFFAPFWVLVARILNLKYNIISLRPIRIDNSCKYFIKDEVLKSVNRKIIILDDQMDTGNTVYTLINLLEKSINVNEFYYSSPGKIYKYNDNFFELIKNNIPISFFCDRLWSKNTKEFTLKIKEIISNYFQDYKQYEVTIYKGDNYYIKDWKWWYDVYRVDKFCHINPKKTTFILKSNTEIHYIVKFIGESIYGKSVYSSLCRINEYLKESIYIDGFIIYKYSNLENFDLHYKNLTLNNLKIVNNNIVKYFTELVDVQKVPFRIIKLEFKLYEKFEFLIQRLSKYIILKIDNKWLKKYISSKISIYSLYNINIKTSLLYSLEKNHWKINTNTLKIYKYHSDYNWGDIHSFEIELSAFFLVNKVSYSNVKTICEKLEENLMINNLFSEIKNCLGYVLYLVLCNIEKSLKYYEGEVNRINFRLDELIVYIEEMCNK